MDLLFCSFWELLKASHSASREQLERRNHILLFCCTLDLSSFSGSVLMVSSDLETSTSKWPWLWGWREGGQKAKVGHCPGMVDT